MRSKEKLFEAMFIPKDAVCKEYNLTTVGNGQLFVEGVEIGRASCRERV